MSKIHVDSSAIIEAPADRVYELIADYRTGHPRMLPAEYFHSLEVEDGGYGAGTVIRFVTRTGRIERPYRMIVSEPEPGRVLMESDSSSTLATTFTVTPIADGARAEVTIATEWEASRGITGMMERALYPPAMRRIYRKELGQLAAVLAEDPAPAFVQQG